MCPVALCREQCVQHRAVFTIPSVPAARPALIMASVSRGGLRAQNGTAQFIADAYPAKSIKETLSLGKRRIAHICSGFSVQRVYFLRKSMSLFRKRFSI